MARTLSIKEFAISGRYTSKVADELKAALGAAPSPTQRIPFTVWCEVLEIWVLFEALVLVKDGCALAAEVARRSAARAADYAKRAPRAPEYVEHKYRGWYGEERTAYYGPGSDHPAFDGYCEGTDAYHAAHHARRAAESTVPTEVAKAVWETTRKEAATGMGYLERMWSRVVADVHKDVIELTAATPRRKKTS
jgi:hypothetical protein